jgi:VWFA-related protein
MKLRVAFVVLTVLGSVAIAQRQPQRQNKGAVSRPAETIRICQGVPIPDGYVIIAYMTSAACPHGAYLLKKQDPYESSLAVNRTNQPAAQPATSNASARENKPTRRGRTTPSAQKSSASETASAGTGSARTSASSSPPAATSDDRAPVASSATRPRRVTAEEPEAGPPTLSGGEVASARRPPTLRNIGTTPDGAAGSDNSSAAPQPTPEEVDENDVVRVETTLVTVPVSVLDHDGRFVSGLKREDFTLWEDNEEQAVAYFEPAEKPFTVALLLDTSASTHFHLDEIKEAAIAFAKQLRPQDRVLVVSFNSEVLLLTEATNNLGTIETVIEENANTGSSTRLYDAVDLTIKERLNQIKGRKAIVLFTDGVDTASMQATYQSTLGEVDELDALIYPIQYDTTDYLRAMQNAGNGTITVTTTSRGIFGTRTTTQTYNAPVNGGVPLPGTTKADYDRADRYLHALADKTGGRMYEANDTAQLAEAFTRIAEELRRQYTLGYYPKTAGVADGERRQIRVRVRQPNLAVKARDSYTKSGAASPVK